MRRLPLTGNWVAVGLACPCQSGIWPPLEGALPCGEGDKERSIINACRQRQSWLKLDTEDVRPQAWTRDHGPGTMDQGAHREGAGSHHGGLEIAISWTVQPKLQMSDFRPYPSPRITSGAIQYGVPRTYSNGSCDSLLTIYFLLHLTECKQRAWG